MIDKILKTVILFSLLLDIMARNYSELFVPHFYYKAESIMIFSISLYLFRCKKNIVTFLIMSLSLSNFFDEAFFNPTKLEVNEFIFAIVVLIFSIKKYATPL